jgi:hypothetical protein
MAIPLSQAFVPGPWTVAEGSLTGPAATVNGAIRTWNSAELLRLTPRDGRG